MSASQRLLRRIGDTDRPSRRPLTEPCFSPLGATRQRARGALGPARSPASWLPGRILATIRLWRRRAYERRLLAQLGECERRDLALTLADIMTEVAKPFWRG
jgi:uncharacterized protein YjiS (DUF1127 family)